MRDLVPREVARVDSFLERGISYSLLQVTANGLNKAILDATRPVREFFLSTGFHNYGTQNQGTEFKVLRAVELVSYDGSFTTVSMSLVRPASGSGDPRLWVSGLREICDAGDIIALYVRAGTMRIENLSKGTSLNVGNSFSSASTFDESESIVRAILDRATGGRDVAARPHDAIGLLPTVHRAAGVDESIEWLLEPSDVPKMLFLVGGPGAGKSHAASSAVNGLEPLDELQSDLANRTYTYNLGDRLLRLVNDATITSLEYRDNPLANEMRRAVREHETMLACVNRGVLVEELAGLSVDEDAKGTADRAILSWLSSPINYAQGLTSEDEQDGPVVITTNSEKFLVTASLRDGVREIARLAVVNLDACSLLELSPAVRIVPTFSGLERELVPSPYKVTRYKERHKLKPHETPAGALFAETFAAVVAENDASSGRDPFAANVMSMGSEAAQAGLLAVLRASEIVTGSNYTFRDLWGVIGRTLIGDAAQQLGWGGTRKTVEALQIKSVSALDRFASLQKLASYRYSQAVFGVGDDTAGSVRAPRDAITRRTSLVDPARDSIPGRFDPKSSTSGWSTPISDAFSGPVESGSPLDTLCELLSESDAFQSVVQPFDRELDSAYVAAVQDPRVGESQRAASVAWYGRYLSRLYAVSSGISAFRGEVDEWSLAWTMSPTLPSSLDSCLRTLIRPARGIESPPAIPALASRVEPIIGDNAQPRIARTSGTFELQTQRDGDSLLLRIVEAASISPWIPLDFPLVRHAASCTAGAIGLTEVADATSPRLERFRSTQLLNAGPTQSDYVVIAGSRTFKIQVGG
jgi:hypothetical protein